QPVPAAALLPRLRTRGKPVASRAAAATDTALGLGRHMRNHTQDVRSSILALRAGQGALRPLDPAGVESPQPRVLGNRITTARMVAVEKDGSVSCLAVTSCRRAYGPV